MAEREKERGCPSISAPPSAASHVFCMTHTRLISRRKHRLACFLQPVALQRCACVETQTLSALILLELIYLSLQQFCNNITSLLHLRPLAFVSSKATQVGVQCKFRNCRLFNWRHLLEETVSCPHI